MFLDPLYMLLLLIGLPLIFIPQWLVKRTYEKYAQVRSASGRTGYDVAREILSTYGLGNVDVEVSHGVLSDHYDPIHKKVRLSEDNYYGTSVAAAAVAAHEVGHALQHAKGFFPVVVRGAMVPVVNFGSQLGPWLIIISLILMGMGMVSPTLGLPIALTGAALFGLVVLFHIVTLPVEIDASMRAVGILQSTRFLSTQELPMAKKVLTAAAFTYIATALYALLQLAYWLYHIFAASRR